MALFLLIRHGETNGNRIAQVMGKSPVPLNEKGREQAQRVADWVRSFSIDHVYTSPVLRAYQTAEIIARLSKLEPKKEEALTEVDYGEWEGRNYKDFPNDTFFYKLIEDPAHTAFPGGESLGDVQKRGVELIHRLSEKHGDETVVLVSHGDPIRSIVAYFMGVPLTEFRKIRIDNGSISALELIEGRAEFKTINQVTSWESHWRERGPVLRGTPI